MREITAGPSSLLGKPSIPQTSMSDGIVEKSADLSQAQIYVFCGLYSPTEVCRIKSGMRARTGIEERIQNV